MCAQPAHAYTSSKCSLLILQGKLKPLKQQQDTLTVFPFINSNPSLLLSFKSELPTYLSKAEDTTPEIDVLTWWKRHEHDLPNWSTICRSILTIQPSSASAERVFSVLQTLFSPSQRSSLEDYIECSLMLHHYIVVYTCVNFCVFFSEE